MFETFPFDNRVVRLTLSGAQLRQVMASEAKRGRRTVGLHGITAAVSCEGATMKVTITRNGGHVVEDSDILEVGTSDYLALGGANVFTAVMPAGGFPLDFRQPLIRDLVVDWLSRRSAPLDPVKFVGSAYQNWSRPPLEEFHCEPASLEADNQPQS
ncbi:MAG: 5'-nucleotidase C-terminal domain-containing protein [Pseudomonadota bacterium]